MTDRIEWEIPQEPLKVGLVVEMVTCCGVNRDNATREDLERACEAVGLHVVDRGVFDAIVAKGEENRLRAEKAEAELAEVVSLIGGDTAIEGAISACRSLNEVVDQKRGLRSERDKALGEVTTLRAQLAAVEAAVANIIEFAAFRIDADISDAATAWQAIYNEWEARGEKLAKAEAQLAEAKALTEATRASWQEAIRIKDKLALASTEGRATDEELEQIARDCYRDSATFEAIARAVAARVRQERPGCLVERLVAGCYDFEVTEQYPEWRVEVRGRKDAAKTVINVPAAEVPATLARLAGLEGGR